MGDVNDDTLIHYLLAGLGSLATLLGAIVALFTKRALSKQDAHDKDIGALKVDTVKQHEFDVAITRVHDRIDEAATNLDRKLDAMSTQISTNLNTIITAIKSK